MPVCVSVSECTYLGLLECEGSSPASLMGLLLLVLLAVCAGECTLLAVCAGECALLVVCVGECALLVVSWC